MSRYIACYNLELREYIEIFRKMVQLNKMCVCRTPQSRLTENPFSVGANKTFKFQPYPPLPKCQL